MEIIYKHTSKTSGKSYIGKTEKTLINRLDEHVKRSKRNLKRHTHFEYAILKYGIDDFISETLEIVNGDINEREKYWINYYNTYNDGYNMTEGGDGGKTKNYVSLVGELNPFFGKSHTDETKKIISEKKKGLVTCKNTITGENFSVSKEEFEDNSDLVGITSGSIGVDSNETRFNKGKSRRGKKFGPAKKFACKHCGKEMDIGNLTRYHNDNCKQKV